MVKVKTVEEGGVVISNGRGRKSPYSDEQKATFSKLISSGRKQGVKWDTLFKTAQESGFKGGLPYFKQMGATTKKAKPKKTKGKKAGRPKGSKNRQVTYKAKAVPKNAPASLHGIGAIVEQMVAEKLAAKISMAVAALEDAAAELKKL